MSQLKSHGHYIVLPQVLLQVHCDLERNVNKTSNFRAKYFIYNSIFGFHL